MIYLVDGWMDVYGDGMVILKFVFIWDLVKIFICYGFILGVFCEIVFVLFRVMIRKF